MSVILTSGVRSNLLSLQNTSNQAEQIQGRLATGKRVNSALDNPTNFFTSQALGGRANDLKSLLDGISNGIKTIEAANNGIETIKKLVESAQSAAKSAVQDKTSVVPTLTGTGTVVAGNTLTAAGSQSLAIGFDADGAGTASALGTLTISVVTATTVQSIADSINAASATLKVTAAVTNGKLVLTGTTAGSTNNSSLSVGGSASVLADIGLAATNNSASGTISAARKKLETQYNEILSQIDQVAKDSGYNGINLLKSTDSLKVVFNELTGSNQSKIKVDGVDTSSSGLGLSTAASGSFQDDDNVNTNLDNLTSALTTLRSNASSFGSNLSIVEARKDFTKNTVNTLQSGADNLVIADTNEEGASLLALQTRQQLSTTALSLANQASQSVLRLF